MWSQETEDLLADYCLEAEIFYYIYNKCVSTYHDRINYFMIPCIIISSITGALLFDDRIKSNVAISYVLASMNIFVAIITTLLKFLNYQDLENQSKILSIKYLELYEDMKLQLSKQPEQRPNFVEYLEQITKKRQELYTNYSFIQDKVKQQFKKRHKELNLPVKLNHIMPVKIYGRDVISINSKTPSQSSVEV